MIYPFACTIKDEDIVYSLVSNPNPEVLTVTMNGRILELVRETEDGAEFDLVMRATSDGQFVDFNIHVVIKEMEGVGENTTTGRPVLGCPCACNG